VRPQQEPISAADYTHRGSDCIIHHVFTHHSFCMSLPAWHSLFFLSLSVTEMWIKHIWNMKRENCSIHGSAFRVWEAIVRSLMCQSLTLRAWLRATRSRVVYEQIIALVSLNRVHVPAFGPALTHAKLKLLQSQKEDRTEETWRRWKWKWMFWWWELKVQERAVQTQRHSILNQCLNVCII
jgi:hypothetical protein